MSLVGWVDGVAGKNDRMNERANLIITPTILSMAQKQNIVTMNRRESMDAVEE